MSGGRWLNLLLIALLMVLVGCAFEYVTKVKGSLGARNANASELMRRKIVDLEILLLPTGVSGTQIIYVAVADDGSMWQKIGVGRWEPQPGLPAKKEE